VSKKIRKTSHFAGGGGGGKQRKLKEMIQKGKPQIIVKGGKVGVSETRTEATKWSEKGGWGWFVEGYFTGYGKKDMTKKWTLPGGGVVGK